MKKTMLLCLFCCILLFPSCQSKGERAQALYHQAETLISENQFDKAEPLLDEILGMFPEDLHAYELKFRIYTAQDNKEKIEETGTRILSLNPSNDEAIEKLAEIYLKKNQKDRALEILQHGSTKKNRQSFEALLDEKIKPLFSVPYTQFDVNAYYQYMLLKYQQYPEEITIGCALFSLVDQVHTKKSRAKSDEIIALVKSNMEKLAVDVDMDSLGSITSGYRVAESSGRLEYNTCDELIEGIYRLNSLIASIRQEVRGQSGQNDLGYALEYRNNPVRNKIFLKTVIEEKLLQVR